MARLQVERETGVPAELTTEALLNCQIAENFLMPDTELILFSAILNDVNAKGGAGAGFSPIPG
ncbi:MAG: hypothetical protein WBZ15_21085 [Mycobacterium sp.]|uniref:hypothetical protein n=1 Tax=Mycobacterium sp. TaxID=1785 RepID=UPI003C4E85CA